MSWSSSTSTRTIAGPSRFAVVIMRSPRRAGARPRPANRRRRFGAEDTATLAAYRSDPAVARYQSWDTPFSHEQARSFIESLETVHPDTPGEWFQFAVVEAATGIHIGDLAARADADDPRLATIGMTLAASAQGRGYAGEAVAWLLGYLFLDRRKHRVTADCDARNSKVVALLDHLGMRCEAHHLHVRPSDPRVVEQHRYDLVDPFGLGG